MLIGFAAVVAVVASCSEQIDSTVGCPLVCPQQPLALVDTTFDGVVSLDTSIANYPSLGFEPLMLLANRPDTFETRVIVRFDTLPYTAHQAGVTVDSSITHVDTAALVLQYAQDDSLNQPVNPYTVEVYDVSAVGDTSTAALLTQFTPGNLIASQVFTNDSLFQPTREIALPTALLLAKITRQQPLRLGLRVIPTAGEAVQLRLNSGQNNNGAYISMDVFSDGESPRITVSTQSRYPTDDAFEANGFGDFVIVAKGPPPQPRGVLRVGGYPANRTMLTFSLPSSIVDSSIVVRATLMLTQRPNPGAPAAADTFTVFPLPILGSPLLIGDMTRLLEFAGENHALGLDSNRVVPRDGGVVEIQLAKLVRGWLGLSPISVPRAVILRASTDGSYMNMVDFYSSEADPALRPRFRITYAPRGHIGLP
jgi:hypothetical protein